MEWVETSEFVSTAAATIARAVSEAVAARGECVLGLCGGKTPEPVYAALASADLPADRILFTFGDERCVGPDDPQSNHRMARLAWFDPAGIPAERVLRMRGEWDPQAAAADYAGQLQVVANRLGHPDGRIVHDVLLLGIGGDGHTASLFPGTAALAETARDVAANYLPANDAWRLTLTYPALNRARHVLFLVNDSSKRAVLDAVRAADPQFPASKVRPVSGLLTWLVGV